MSWCCEGIPRDVEPAVACQKLVGIRTGAKEVHQFRELPRVFGSNVRGLPHEVLRVLDTTHQSVDAGVAEAGVDEDGTDHLAGGLQQHQAAIGHVRHVLHGGFIIRIFAHVEEFAQRKVRREPSVIDCCVFHRFSW